MNPYPSLQVRIDECMQQCSANMECKFFFVSSVACQQYRLCDGFRTPDYQGYTFEKQIKGKINVSLIKFIVVDFGKIEF